MRSFLMVFPLMVSLGLGPLQAEVSAPPSQQSREQHCIKVSLAWNRAKEAGPVGRRNGLAAQLAASEAGDRLALDCLGNKLVNDYVIAAYDSGAAKGWVGLIRELRLNLVAAREQTPARRCAALHLGAMAAQFLLAKQRDVPEFLTESTVKERNAACPNMTPLSTARPAAL